MPDATATPASDLRDCLVCGHSGADHSSGATVCAGSDGLCQCHAYNPDEHPVQRLAARRDASTG